MMEDQNSETALMTGARLTLDLGAVAANYRLIKRQVAPSAVAGVVKADGYGVGAEQVAKALIAEGCRHFFVGQLIEAKKLIAAIGDAYTVYVLNGLSPGAEAICQQIGAVPVLSSLGQIQRWSKLAETLARPLSAAVQVDTGMSRMGLSREEIDQLNANPQLLNNIQVELVMSHLACADEVDHPANREQLKCFQSLKKLFPDAIASLDNSGGCFHQRDHFDLVRPGIALYGGAPTDASNPMQPVARLEAKITQIRTLNAGSAVGYGLTFTARRRTLIATISIGYADGWPRHLSNLGHAFVANIRVPIAGRVSMDCITLDVTDVPQGHLFEGALVELIGPNQTIDDVANTAGTISYEILTQLGHRYERIHLPIDKE